VLELEGEGGLVLVTLRGELAPDALDRLFTELDARAATTDGPLGTLFDARALDVRSLGFTHQRVARGHLRRMRPMLKRRYRAEAVVVATRAAARLIRGAHLVFRPAKRCRVFLDRDEAERWVRAELG